MTFAERLGAGGDVALTTPTLPGFTLSLATLFAQANPRIAATRTASQKRS